MKYLILFFICLIILGSLIYIMERDKENILTKDELEFVRISYQKGYVQALVDVFYDDISLPFMRREIEPQSERRSYEYKVSIKKTMKAKLNVYSENKRDMDVMITELIKEQPMIWTFNGFPKPGANYKCLWCGLMVTSIQEFEQ